MKKTGKTTKNYVTMVGFEKAMASVAQEHYKSMPLLLRYLLNLMGAKSHSGDLLSFLLFEKEFTRELLELGYQDTIASADEVSAFFM